MGKINSINNNQSSQYNLPDTSFSPVVKTLGPNLQLEFDLLDKISKSKVLNAAELKESIEKVNDIGKSFLKEVSRNQAYYQNSMIIEEMKSKVCAVKKRLEGNEQKGTTDRIAIIFDSGLSKNEEKQGGQPEKTTKESINEKEFILHLINSLDSLEKDIKNLQTLGIIVEEFKKNSSFPEKLAIYRDKFITGLFGVLLEKMSNLIFLGHMPQLNLAKARTELNQLNKKEEKINEELKKILNELQEHANNSESETSKIDRKTNQLNDKINKFEADLKKISNKTEKITQVISSLEKKAELGKQTRANLHAIGGINVKMKLDDANLDGMYISCDSFRKTLKEAGAKAYEIKFTPVTGSPMNQPLSLKTLIFPVEFQGSGIDQTLSALRTFGAPDKEGAGWQKIYVADGILIVTDSEARKLRRMGLLKENGQIIENSDYSIVHKIEDWDISKQETGGTVLLTSGNAGVYEMSKREMLTFLMRGMNVMAFNFRGYGESTGHPTEDGVKRDMEAAYQYLKQQQEIPDEKIMLKALCMSGGPAAELAANHPKVNLFIDQSYANFQDIVKDQVNNYIDNFIDDNSLSINAFGPLRAWLTENLRLIVQTLLQFVVPAWSIEKNIGKVEGHVGILLTKQDSIMQLNRDVYKNYQAALNSKLAQSVSVFAMEGRHADLWLDPIHRSHFIRPSKEAIVEEDLKNHPTDAAAIGENFEISFPSDPALNKIIHSLLKEILKEGKKINRLFLQTECFKFQESLNVKIRDQGEMISQVVLDEIIKSQTDKITNEEEREIVKRVLEKSIKKYDRLTPYKTTTVKVKLEKEELDHYSSIFPDMTRDKVRNFLELRLQILKQGLDEGQQIEKIIDKEVDKVDDFWKPVVRECLTKHLTPKDPLKGLFDVVMDYMQNNEITPKQINEFIHEKIDEFPPAFRKSAEEFMNKHIPISEDLLDEDTFEAMSHKGRVQMDLYLEKANLMRSLIYWSLD